MSSDPVSSSATRHDDICDVPGIRVGHETWLDAGTGCTVVLCEWPALGAVDVRGGAPATRETDLLHPLSFMREVHAIVLSGGSAFGLDAASGVVRALEQRGVGYDTGIARVPIVPAAALFDLGVGRADRRPDTEAGARAVAAASGGPVAQGSVGAGTGATVGKLGGPRWATKGGIGSASTALPGGYRIGALVAVNAIGDIYDAASGALLAGARSPSGSGWLAHDPPTADASRTQGDMVPWTNTTLAVIATDMPWSKAELAKIAQMAQDGLARTIRPAHIPLDGDVIFALSTACNAAPLDQSEAARWPLLLGNAGAAAAETLARAVNRAVRAATGLHGVPALRDLAFT